MPTVTRVRIPERAKLFFSVAVYMYLNDLTNQFMTLLFARYRHIWYQNDDNEMFYHTIRFIFKNIFSDFIYSFLGIFSVTVTLTFDPRSPISIVFEPVS